MEGRIVITFRAPGGPGRGFLERAMALEARVRARGGVMVAWDGTRVSFAFEGAKLPDVLGLVTGRGEDTADGEPAWSVGLAQGDLKSIAEDGSHGALAWGTPLVAATILSASARPGQILCARTVQALSAGELITAGACHARDGEVRVRGVRLDPVSPWRWQAVEKLAHMRVGRLVGGVPSSPSIERGALVVLRADPGAGGTRYLTELASRAPRALLVTPSGSSFEPLGALRRALARSTTRELSPLLLELAGPLEKLIAGEGVSLEVAASLVTAFLWPTTEGQAPSVLLLDDAKGVDPATLEACVRATHSSAAPFGVVARLDATGGLPSVLASIQRSAETEIAPLSRAAAEELARGCTSDGLDAVARQRWARLAANVPLGVVESIAHGIATGDLRWTGDKAAPRSRSSGRGAVRGAADWIRLRARDESLGERTLLCLIALLGGEAKVTRLLEVIERAEQAIDVESCLGNLVRGRWLVDTQEDWMGLPSRTHRDALATLLDAETRNGLHRAAAEVIQKEEGVFGRVEAAWHALQAGEGAAAARILLAAARGTAGARLEASTTQLIAFARRADPSCEEEALELLANALSRAPSIPPTPARSVPPPGSAHQASIPPLVVLAGTEFSPSALEVHDSEPPTIARLALAPMAEHEILRSLELVAESPEPASSGVNIATRLGELAKEALLGADNAALERWVDGLRAAGESPLFTERLRALSRLGRGDIGDALRVLRRTRTALDPGEHRLRCQTSLALGVALSVAGRPQEALLEGMDALARARHVGDERGADACLAFLSKLYASVGRQESFSLRPSPSG